MKERDMRSAVHAWLTDQGYTVIYEFQMRGYCDMVGVVFAERVGRAVPPLMDAVAVELKLSDIAGVINQAWENRQVVPTSFAAMPWGRVAKMNFQSRERFRRAGVGLLVVSDFARVTTEIEPGTPLAEVSTGHLARRMWDRTVRDKRLGRKNAP